MGETRGIEAGGMSVEEQLAFQGEVFINFRNHTYQWVSIKLFALPANTSDHAVLQLLTHHVRYRDSYGGTADKDMETIHGPYWLNAITPESFSPVPAVDVEALIRTWAEYAAPLPDTRRDEMEHELYARIRNATARYQLADLRDTAQHDQGWGSSVGSATGFHELVLIDRRTGIVALAVASDD